VGSANQHAGAIGTNRDEAHRLYAVDVVHVGFVEQFVANVLAVAKVFDDRVTQTGTAFEATACVIN
jgi:hypothetical protein